MKMDDYEDAADYEDADGKKCAPLWGRFAAYLF